MKQYRHVMPFFICLILVGFVSGNSQAESLADEEQAVSALRDQLGQTDGQKPVASHEIFTLDEEDLESANSELLAAEAALLKKLDNENISAEPVPAASGEMDSKTFVREASPAEQKSIKKAEQTENMQKHIYALETKLSQRDKSLVDARGETTRLRARLSRTEKELAQLRNELAKTQDQLMMAETEVERLSGVLKTRQKKSSAQAPAPARRARQAAKASGSDVDMPVATVTVQKANLRVAPGLKNSPLMTVSRGTRLVVETRQGDWYRILTPTGKRAWISASVVSFGRGGRAKVTDTIRVKGYDKNVR